MIERNELSKDQISHVVYSLYLQRGCAHGEDVQDWVKAVKVGGCAETRAKLQAIVKAERTKIRHIKS